MLFLTVCVGMVFISRRSAIEKIIIVLSAPVIALLANVVRITLTAVLNTLVSHHAGTTLYHDLAGCLMMPLAVVFLWLELAYLSRVFVANTTSEGVSSVNRTLVPADSGSLWLLNPAPLFANKLCKYPAL